MVREDLFSLSGRWNYEGIQKKSRQGIVWRLGGSQFDKFISECMKGKEYFIKDFSNIKFSNM